MSNSLFVSRPSCQQGRALGTDLTDAELIQSSFEGAELGEAILTGANFEETNLKRANLLGCIGATIYSAIMGPSILPDCNIGHEDRYTYS